MITTALKRNNNHKYNLLMVTLVVIALFSFASYAQKVEDPQLVDPALEQQLDDYVSLLSDAAISHSEFLQQVIAQVSPKTPIMTRVRAMCYKASEYAYADNYDEAFRLLDKLEPAVEAAGVVDAKVELLGFRTEFLFYQGKTSEAFLNVPILESQLKDVKSTRIQYYAYSLLSRIYTEWERYEQALSSLLNAQRALQQTTTDSRLKQQRRLYLVTSIAQIHNRLEDWQQAIDVVDGSIGEAKNAGFDEFVYDLSFEKYYAQSALGQYESALVSLQRTYQLSIDLNFTRQQAVLLNNFGDTYMKLKQFDKARQYLLKASEQAKAEGYDDLAATIEFNLAFMNVQQGDTAAIDTMERIVADYREELPDQDFDMLLAELAKVYAQTGRFEAEAQLLKERLELRETIFQESKQDNLAQLQVLYQSRDRAQQIKLLRQENQLKEQTIRASEQQQLIWWLLAGVSLISLLLMYLLYKKSRLANQLLNQTNQQLAVQSMRDPLTKLYNRRALHQLMLNRENLPARAEPDALVLLDVDYFKQVNDRLGHALGDQVLLELSNRLLGISRDSDSIFRWGGEEFLFFVRDINKKDLQHLVKRILQVIGTEPFQIGDEMTQVTATIGYVQLPFDGINENIVDWERALHLADMALYMGKEHGRNCACGISTLKVDYDVAARTLEHDLQQAVDNNWVEVDLTQGPQQ